MMCRAEELEKQRKLLDASERMEAELMIEVDCDGLAVMNVDWQVVENDGFVHVHLSFDSGTWGRIEFNSIQLNKSFVEGRVGEEDFSVGKETFDSTVGLQKSGV